MNRGGLTMYFKSLKLQNFRKFRTNDNVIELADAETDCSRYNLQC